MKRSSWKLALVVGWLLLAFAGPLAAQQPTELFISEYIEGSSNNKAIEIYNPTEAAINLGTAGYNIQMFFNGSASAGLTINLVGSIAPRDVFVIANSAATAAIRAQADQTNGSGWFNGDDAVVLRKGTTIIDVIGQVGFDPGSEWGTGLTSTADNTLRRKSSVTAGDTTGTDAFDASLEWEGQPNDTIAGLGFYPDPAVPDPVNATICEIQGSGAQSPFLSSRVITTGIVTAVATASRGFFIQMRDGDADADERTSNGIFVYTASLPTVTVGDEVRVTAMVSEYYECTELTFPTTVTLSSGNPVPAPVVLTAVAPDAASWPHDWLERFEGMLVQVNEALVTGPTDSHGDTPIVTGGARPFREPGIEWPGISGYPTWDGNPEVFEITTGIALPAGSTVNAVGPLSYSFGDYQIWPTTLACTPAEIGRPVRGRSSGELTVANQNMLQFFRGNDPDAFADRLAKASSYIRGVLGAPDVLTVEEVEDLGVLQDLAARIQADEPSVRYSAHLLEGHDIGGIDIGFLVRDTVSVKAVNQVGFDTPFGTATPPSYLHDRPPLVLEAEYVANGKPFGFTVIGVHNRSLNGIDGSDGARVRQKRLAQAVELAEYVETLQAADATRKIIVTGDFNAYEFSDGYVDVLGVITGELDSNGAMLVPDRDYVEPDLVNQVGTLPASERYSYVYEGSAQALDHVLTTANLGPFVREMQFSRGNADVPESLAGDVSIPWRLADHDGAVLFVMTDFDGDGLADDRDACPHSVSIATVIVGGHDTGVPESVSANGCSIGDGIQALADASSNHGDFVSQVAHLVTQLRQAETITNKEASALTRAAAWANVK